MTTPEQVDVAVIGGGPAGLAAAVALRRAGHSVTVLEREDGVGGIARHADHTGYGLREFGRVLRGPAYARRWSERVLRADVDVRTRTTVTGWADDDARTRTLRLTAPTGLSALHARAVVLATGTRERPRSARLVPGTRPLGVLTTGSLQRLAAMPTPGRDSEGMPQIGREALIVGAEHVSFSAVLTLRHAGCRTVAMTTSEPRHQSYAALRAATAGRYRVPVLTRTAITDIRGHGRVDAVELTDLATGATRLVPCDTVVFTGDWYPDNELARRGEVAIDAGTHAPRVDTGLRTAVPGVFAAGNLLHGAETAGVCAASGRWVARTVADWLAAGASGDGGGSWPSDHGVAIECAPPLRWVSPNLVVPGDRAGGAARAPHGHLLARSTAFARRARVSVRQGGRELWEGRVGRVVPTMPVHLPDGWLERVEGGGPVRITMTG